MLTNTACSRKQLFQLNGPQIITCNVYLICNALYGMYSFLLVQKTIKNNKMGKGEPASMAHPPE